MAVLNSNLKRIILIASLMLFLSACADLGSTANNLIENSGIQEVAGASDSEAANAASSTENEGASALQATPTLSATSEPTAELDLLLKRRQLRNHLLQLRKRQPQLQKRRPPRNPAQQSLLPRNQLPYR